MQMLLNLGNLALNSYQLRYKCNENVSYVYYLIMFFSTVKPRGKERLDSGQPGSTEPFLLTNHIKRRKKPF